MQPAYSLISDFIIQLKNSKIPVVAVSENA